MKNTSTGVLKIGRLVEELYNGLIGRELIFEGDLDPEELEVLSLLEDAENPVDVNGLDPNNKPANYQKVGVEAAIQDFSELEEELSGDKNYSLRTSFWYTRRGSVKFEIGQNVNRFTDPYNDALTYRGTLEIEVERSEVEELLNQYGLDEEVF